MRNKIIVLGAVLILIITYLIYDFNKPVELVMMIPSDSYFGIGEGKVEDIINDAIIDFERENPEITVKLESSNLLPSYNNVVANKMIASDDLDIFMIDDKNLLNFSNTELLKKFKNVDTSIFYNSVLTNCTDNGKIIALPFLSDLEVMVLDGDLLNKVNIAVSDLDDRENFIETIKKLKRNHVLAIDNFDYPTILALSDTSLVNDGEIAVNDEKLLTALTTYLTIDHYQTDLTLNAISDTFAIRSNSYLETVKNRNTIIAPFPFNDNQAVSENVYLAVSAKSNNSKEALKFATFLATSTTIQQELVDKKVSLSSLKAIDQNEVNSLFENSTTLTYYQDYDLINDYFSLNLNQLDYQGDIKTDLTIINRSLKQYLGK